MSDQWEIYLAPVDEMPAMIVVDLGIRDTAPDHDRPILLWMWLTIQAPDENGFETEEEEATLTKIEDTFIDAVEMTTDAIMVGRVTTCGRREFYFYARSDEGFADSIEEAMQEFEDYEFETGSKDDDEWTHYLDVLAPAPEDMHQIYNRRTIEQLVESGDQLKSPRAVDHYASFGTEDHRSSFIKAATDKGYEVLGRNYKEDPDCERPYAVRVQKISPVDWDTIDEITFELFELAEDHDGDYDGWDSPVVPGKN